MLQSRFPRTDQVWLASHWLIRCRPYLLNGEGFAHLIATRDDSGTDRSGAVDLLIPGCRDGFAVGRWIGPDTLTVKVHIRDRDVGTPVCLTSAATYAVSGAPTLDGEAVTYGVVHDSGVVWYSPDGIAISNDPLAAFVLELAQQARSQSAQIAVSGPLYEQLAGIAVEHVGNTENYNGLVLGPILIMQDGLDTTPDLILFAHATFDITRHYYCAGLSQSELGLYQELRSSGLSPAEAQDAISLLMVS